jgi:hypothetical protein
MPIILPKIPYDNRMTEDTPIDKTKFDTLLKRLIDSKPVTGQDARSAPKLRKDGQPRRGKPAKKRTRGIRMAEYSDEQARLDLTLLSAIPILQKSSESLLVNRLRYPTT